MRKLLYILLFGTSLFGEVVSVESPTFQKEELSSIQKKLGIQVGENLNLTKINEGIENLYKSENQRLIFLEVNESAKGTVVVIRGTRFRKLRALKFVRVDEDIEEAVLRDGGFEIGKAIDLGKLSILRERIKSEYQTRGYQFASVEVQMIEDEKSGSVDVEVSVLENVGTRVSKIELVGVNPIDAKEIKEFIPLKIGSIYSKKAVDDSSEALRQYFKRNRQTTSRVEETNVRLSEDKLFAEVSFQLKLGDRYQFEFQGNNVFNEVELRSLFTEEALSQSDAMMRIAEQIEKKYKRAGFHFVKVEVKTETLKEDKVQVNRFVIDEGHRVIIDGVLFNGAGAIKESELESLFIANAPGVLNRSLYWEEGLPDATLRLRQKLESMGFLSASLTGPRIAFSEDKKGVELIYDVDLGNQTRFRRFDFKGNEKISESSLLAELPYKSGDLVNWERVNEIKRSVLEKYRSEGYVDVALEETNERRGLILSPDQRDGDILLTLKEGAQFFVGSIEVEGNKRTRTHVILREVPLNTGDKFDPQKLKDAEENIALLQLFSRVEIITFPSPSKPNQKDIKIVVVEIKPGSGEIGLGAAYEEPRFRARSFLGLQYRNLWGLNHTASQRTELTIPLSHQQTLIPFIEYAILLGYRAPYPLELPFVFSAQAGLDSFELTPVGGQSVLQTRARIEGRIERRFSRVFTGIYRLHRYERTTTENLTGSEVNKKTDSIGSTGPGVIFDFRDDTFNPTRGSYHTLDLEFAHPNLLSQSEIAFVMAIARNSFYFPLSGNVGFIFYGGAGYAKSLISSPLPVARLANDLSLGGQSSLRGYSSKEYNPNVSFDPNILNTSETAFLNARAEIVTPLVDNVSGALFFDSGQLYPNMAPMGRRDGFGIGFRYKTPVGPVVIDIAHGFQSRDKNVKFTFTIGSI